MNTVDEMRRLLAPLGLETQEISDDAGRHVGHAAAGGHFSLYAVGEVFAQKSRTERQRLVYNALRPLIPGRIHALRLRTLTPEERDAEAASFNHLQEEI